MLIGAITGSVAGILVVLISVLAIILCCRTCYHVCLSFREFNRQIHEKEEDPNNYDGDKYVVCLSIAILEWKETVTFISECSLLNMRQSSNYNPLPLDINFVVVKSILRLHGDMVLLIAML